MSQFLRKEPVSVCLTSKKRDWHDPSFLKNASVEQKEAWLSSLMAQSPESVDVEAFLVVLRALAKSDRPDAAVKSERWLFRLEQSDNKITPMAAANAECYQRVIEAWARAHHEDPGLVVIRAERWLTKHLESPEASLHPTTATFDAFLDACSKGRGLKGSMVKGLVRQHAEKTEYYLRRMIDDRKTKGAQSLIAPSTDSFNYAIRAWTRCRNSMDVADKALESLHLMESYQQIIDPKIGPNVKSYVMVMDALSVKARLKMKHCSNNPSLRDDPNENGLMEIQMLGDILQYIGSSRMGGAGTLSLDDSVVPNTYMFNTLIAAWANLSSSIHPYAPNEAEKVLEHMENLVAQGTIEASPDSVSYGLVMRAWANSDHPSKAGRVSWYLERIWQEYESKQIASLHPTTALYNIAIRVWADVGDPTQAEAMFLELLQHSQRSEKLKPSSESFSMIIRAWLVVAATGDCGALKKAVRWINYVADQEREETGLMSSVENYTSFLGVARKCAIEHPDALVLSQQIFAKVKSSHHNLDCLHYSRLLEVGLLSLSHSTENERRTSFVTQLIQQCAEDGLVSGPLIRALANGPVFYEGFTIEESSRLVSAVFGRWPLPNAWTRNVRLERLQPKLSDLQRKNFQLH